MKKGVLVVLLTTVFFTVNAQPISWDLQNQDTTVTAGTEVNFYGHLITDSNQVYSCEVYVLNNALPADWYFSICNPFLCLIPNVEASTFNYPDTVDQNYFNEGYGSTIAKITIHAAQGNTAEVGELDFVLKNNQTNEVFSRHLIVSTNGQSVSMEENSTVYSEVFPNPVESTLFVSNCEPNSRFVISDLTGRFVLEGRTEGTIDCSAMKNGRYLLTVETAGGNSFTRLFQKR